MSTQNRFPTSLTVPLILLAVVSIAQDQYSGGTGEADDPYQIATAADLIALGQTPEDYDKHFILTADIDLDPNLPGRRVFDRAVIAPATLEATAWPSALHGIRFTGVFDGNGHTISHLTMTGGEYLGLFGLLGSGGVIRDLSVTDIDITGSLHDTGGLVARNSGCIYTCRTSGCVSGAWGGTGGLAGDNSGVIIACYSMCTVHTDQGGYSGGLVGFNGTTRRSYTTVVGYKSCAIVMSYSTGKVTYEGEHTTGGGFVGWSNGCDNVISCYWDTETSGLDTSKCGVGLAPTELKNIVTYLQAGWDCIDETLNGTCDYWQVSPGEYPQLHYTAIASHLMPEGRGTAEQPYLIRDANDLGKVWLQTSAHYRLEASINLSTTTWSAAVVPFFEGTFDGNGYEISGLFVQGSEYLGLFGLLGPGAEISNVGLHSADVSGAGDYVGGLVGYNNGGSLSDCYCIGTVKGDHYVGGLIGLNDDGTIANCYSMGTVIGEQAVGGLIGLTSYGSIEMSYSKERVSGGEYIGGLVGESLGRIANCYATGTITGEILVGGLVGFFWDGSVTTSYSMGRVSGAESIGGLVGYVYMDEITSSYWDIESSGQTVSDGGVGLTTAEMQTATTYLNAGWDFVDEAENGPNDVWKIVEGQTYPLLSWQKYGGGTGEPNDPYLIYTAEHLNALAAEPNDYDKHFKLMADIDLSRYVYDRAVIAPDVNDVEDGFQGASFIGVFDGNGHAISHLTIRGASYVGLFGQLGWGFTEVANLGLEAVDVNGTGDYIGGLVGDNCSGDAIWSCYSTGIVSGNTYVGGLVGMSDESWIVGCSSEVDVRGTSCVGGLVGGNTWWSLIDMSYSKGTVIGDSEVGGLAGRNTDSFVWSSYSTCTVNGKQSVGGLVGKNTYRGEVSGCYYSGAVSGVKYVGGLVGWHGDVGRGSYIRTSYSIGTVAGDDSVGGLVGWNDDGGIVIQSYWDVDRSKVLNMCGDAYHEELCDNATGGLTTAEMQTASTFLDAGWDFIDETENGTDDIWWIDEGQDYPRLWWEPRN